MSDSKKVVIQLDGIEIEIEVRRTNDGVALQTASHPKDFWEDEEIDQPDGPAPTPEAQGVRADPAPAKRTTRSRRAPATPAILPIPLQPIWSLSPGARVMFPDENGNMFKGKVSRLEGANVFVNVQGEEWEVPADEVEEWK